MKKTYYYEYIPGFLGMETNIINFGWSFGNNTPETTKDVFSSCIFKVYLESKKDKDVFCELEESEYTSVFRHFKLKPGKKSLIFEQDFAKIIHLRYSITICENSIHLVVGNSYLKVVKTKIMNIHPIQWILLDLLSIMMLQKGYLPLYCSSVTFDNSFAKVLIGPPNTGKSITALRLGRDYDASIISEDLAITDGVDIFGAPYTNMYRDYKDISLNEYKSNVAKGKYRINSIFLLEKGVSGYRTDNNGISAGEYLQIINDYLLGYASSPVCRALNYYNSDFSIKNSVEMESAILSQLSECAIVGRIISDNSVTFADEIMKVNS